LEGTRGRPRGTIRAVRIVPPGRERTAPLPGARGPGRRIVEPSISRVRLSLTSRPTQADFGALPGDRRLLPPNRVRMVRPLECGATSALRTPVTIAGIGQTEGRLRGKGPAWRPRRCSGGDRGRQA